MRQTILGLLSGIALAVVMFVVVLTANHVVTALGGNRDLQLVVATVCGLAVSLSWSPIVEALIRRINRDRG